jgi:hypothetical protein
VFTEHPGWGVTDVYAAVIQTSLQSRPPCELSGDEVADEGWPAEDEGHAKEMGGSGNYGRGEGWRKGKVVTFFRN